MRITSFNLPHKFKKIQESVAQSARTFATKSENRLYSILPGRDKNDDSPSSKIENHSALSERHEMRMRFENEKVVGLKGSI